MILYATFIFFASAFSNKKFVKTVKLINFRDVQVISFFIFLFLYFLQDDGVTKHSLITVSTTRIFFGQFWGVYTSVRDSG